MKNNIYVTSPLLPPLNEFIPYLEKIWENKCLTNGGPFHQQLEKELADYLGVEHLCLFTNGTLALLTALQALKITGEVITTPYSFVATSHTLLWNGLKPVFVDIDPVTCNIDPDRIEAAITPETSAILPVHCYGIPCDVDKIQNIADTYGLKIIYDAAHAFGVKKGNSSVLRYGDLSVLSLHATKVFNTFEGGAIICPDAKMKQRIDYLKNFGFAEETKVVAPGINGKMSEIQAAFGLLQLNYIDDALIERQSICNRYCELLAYVPYISIPSVPESIEWNYSYFPIFIKNNSPVSRDELFAALKENGIFTRRYFYPLISDFPMYRGLPSACASLLPMANSVACSVLCLPIYPGLSASDQDRVISIITSSIATASH
ncbi:DegT/DnrJ/EryC1/StrS family aminotransferase [Pectobacteriaceae bacterium CE90]|nr:DegT/DnrJ/EryC1/StrS family aminotransferase [Prodigiosinella sp. LS101]WJV52150.1 DegT/DnrJ/EryC1/StrS family aminotransferase [Prodigiosinella sp. LS101]WJV56508.1 DegT/DnrJ/EryC1/StrS family aminotransferase [Pectobacteriaceae bacterium C111]WJY16665.1 DegT/DnrJ/EryC1/StrS family aminotransferase [Pectobacteriaceae bacterium CE90]